MCCLTFVRLTYSRLLQQFDTANDRMILFIVVSLPDLSIYSLFSDIATIAIASSHKKYAKVWPFINQKDAEKQTFQSLLTTVMYYILVSLKSTENSEAVSQNQEEPISPVLAALHWFPVTFKIGFYGPHKHC